MFDRAAARDYALRLLGRRDHTRADLERKLVRRGVDRSIIDELISRLTDDGYLDDRRFARRWAESAVASGRCLGPRLRLELRRRGVPAEIAEQTASELTEGYEEFSVARTLLERKFPGFDPVAADDRDKRRVFGFLQRRGVSTATIVAIFRNLIRDDQTL